jgi:hypothetical protein
LLVFCVVFMDLLGFGCVCRILSGFNGIVKFWLCLWYSNLF